MDTQTEREINAYWRYMTDVTVPMEIRLLSVDNFEKYLYLHKISPIMAGLYHLGKLITYIRLHKKRRYLEWETQIMIN